MTRNAAFTLSGELRNLSASGFGGNSQNGNAGAATGGLARIQVSGSTANLGASMALAAQATGGNASGEGAGGAADGGITELVGGSGADITVGSLAFNANALAGSGSPVNSSSAGSSATGGSARINLLAATLTGGVTTADTSASAQTADAVAGGFRLSAGNGSRAGLTSLSVSAGASSPVGNVDVTGGSALIETLSGTASTLAIPTIALNHSVQGSTLADLNAGFFTIRAGSGQISSNIVTATATNGAIGTRLSELAAVGGDITIETRLETLLNGNLTLRYGQGSKLIGGETANTPGAVFNLAASGTISLIGDSVAAPGIVAQALQLASGDITIDPLARASADVISFRSLDTSNKAQIGGTAEGPGYTLTQAEADGVSAQTLIINLPALSRSGPPNPAAVDAEIVGLSLPGSQNDGFSSISVQTDANLLISGPFAYIDAASGDRSNSPCPARWPLLWAIPPGSA